MGIASFVVARDRLVAIGSSELSAVEVCGEIARAIADVVHYDACAVMMTDPATHLPAGGVVTGFDAEACAPFWDNELSDPDFNKFNDLVKSVDPVATLAEATDGDLTRSPRHTRLYAPFGASDELRFVVASSGASLAIGAFVRCDGSTFSVTEVNDVRTLLAPAKVALRNALRRWEHDSVERSHAIVVLDGECEMLSSSVAADEVLEDLRVAEIHETVPGTIRAAAGHALRSRDATPVTTMLRGRSGRWIRADAVPLADSAGVAVTLGDPAPSDLIPILLDSYGLTAREADLVLALCRGLSTKELAAELCISAHTVRDHLKSVFEKAGVNSRGELVAALFASHLRHGFEGRMSSV